MELQPGIMLVSKENEVSEFSSWDVNKIRKTFSESEQKANLAVVMFVFLMRLRRSPLKMRKVRYIEKNARMHRRLPSSTALS